jgi:hypothetical protein
LRKTSEKRGGKATREKNEGTSRGGKKRHRHQLREDYGKQAMQRRARAATLSFLSITRRTAHPLRQHSALPSSFSSSLSSSLSTMPGRSTAPRFSTVPLLEDPPLIGTLFLSFPCFSRRADLPISFRRCHRWFWLVQARQPQGREDLEPCHRAHSLPSLPETSDERES